MLDFLSPLIKRIAFAAAALLCGCSIHPIPDDISRYSTEEIVRNVRCEAKEAVKQRIAAALEQRGLYGFNPEMVLEDKAEYAEILRRAPDLARKFIAYGVSTIGYTFDFDITETNDKGGALGFKIPYADGGSFSLDLNGAIHKERNGKRNFKTVETFRDLVRLRCENWVQPGGNIVYPLTGSVGVNRIINTFISVSETGGGSGDYSDIVVFTTKLNGSVNPNLVLAPVVDRFRLVSASANFAADREDVHKLTIAISFPKIDLRPAVADMPIRASYLELVQDTRTRALQNMCIVNAREREDRFGTLRLTPPEEYCRSGAASFGPTLTSVPPRM